MAHRLVIAITADGEVRLTREGGEGGDEMARLRLAHLAQVDAHVTSPARFRPVRGVRPRDDGGAGRELGQPDVVVVALRVVRLADTARRPADGAEAHTLALRPRAAETDDADRHPYFLSQSLFGRARFTARGG